MKMRFRRQRRKLSHPRPVLQPILLLAIFSMLLSICCAPAYNQNAIKNFWRTTGLFGDLKPEYAEHIMLQGLKTFQTADMLSALPSGVFFAFGGPRYTSAIGYMFYLSGIVLMMMSSEALGVAMLLQGTSVQIMLNSVFSLTNLFPKASRFVIALLSGTPDLATLVYPLIGALLKTGLGTPGFYSIVLALISLAGVFASLFLLPSTPFYPKDPQAQKLIAEEFRMDLEGVCAAEAQESGPMEAAELLRHPVAGTRRASEYPSGQGFQPRSSRDHRTHHSHSRPGSCPTQAAAAATPAALSGAANRATCDTPDARDEWNIDLDLHSSTDCYAPSSSPSESNARLQVRHHPPASPPASTTRASMDKRAASPAPPNSLGKLAVAPEISEQVHEQWQLQYGSAKYKCSEEAVDDVFCGMLLTALPPETSVPQSTRRRVSSCVSIWSGTPSSYSNPSFPDESQPLITVFEEHSLWRQLCSMENVLCVLIFSVQITTVNLFADSQEAIIDMVGDSSGSLKTFCTWALPFSFVAALAMGGFMEAVGSVWCMATVNLLLLIVFGLALTLDPAMQKIACVFFVLARSTVFSSSLAYTLETFELKHFSSLVSISSITAGVVNYTIGHLAIHLVSEEIVSWSYVHKILQGVVLVNFIPIICLGGFRTLPTAAVRKVTVVRHDRPREVEPDFD